ncbi:16414_t:CDS:2 [Funneliformis geosporum]|uniref:16414_t:CDS:1 n=1 Tax=Funneliformis geosporum TaxID=1117311 RepID=A0A9W4SB86_9GLOM|nr:16414_t:CDS:2 [Funneliformis geosporum]
MSETKKLGELVVVAIRAKNLATRDVIGKGDPFVTFRINEEAKRIKAEKRGGQHPEWDEEVRFDLLDIPNSKRMKIQVFNEDKRDPILIGDSLIDLSQVLEKGEWDDWHEIKYRNNATPYPPVATNQPPLSAPSAVGYPPLNVYPSQGSTSPPPSQPPQFFGPQRTQSPVSSQYPPVSTSVYPPQASQVQNIYPTQPQGYPQMGRAPPDSGGNLAFPLPVPTPNIASPFGGPYPSYNAYPASPPQPPTSGGYQQPPYPPNNIYPPPTGGNIYPPPQNTYSQGYPYPPNSYPPNGPY